MPGTGSAFISTAVILAVPQKVHAEDAEFYINRGIKKIKSGDYSGANEDLLKAMEIDLLDALKYGNLGTKLRVSQKQSRSIQKMQRRI